jgi:hypothetical protein
MVKLNAVSSGMTDGTYGVDEDQDQDQNQDQDQDQDQDQNQNEDNYDVSEDDATSIPPSLPLIPPFDSLRVTTLTVVVPLLKISALNLLAIFTLLPYYEVDLSIPLPKGKFKYPKEWNKNGEIVSIRYGNLTRGYQRKRKPVRAFPYNISIDIGTSKRIVNVKFSQTIKVTGAPDLITAREAVIGLLHHLSTVQELLLLYKSPLPLSSHMLNQESSVCQVSEVVINNDEPTYDSSVETSDMVLDSLTNGLAYALAHQLSQKLTCGSTDNHIDYQSTTTIIDEMVYDELLSLYNDREKETIEFFLQAFNGPLYEGELTCGKYEVEMINMNFDIGLMINRRKMAEIFNNQPFACWYNNILPCPKLLIYHFYAKTDKYGKQKIGKQTFKVCETGNITFSGPHPDNMRIIYNTFMTRVLANYDNITTRLQKTRQTDVTKGRTMKYDGWLALRQSELQYTADLAAQRLPIYEKEIVGVKYVIDGDDIPNLRSVLSGGGRNIGTVNEDNGDSDSDSYNDDDDEDS